MAVVTNTNDAGAGSLRAAVLAAAPAEVITFDPGVVGTIFLTTGQIQITQAITITGPGSGVLTVAAVGSRVFNTNSGIQVITGLSLGQGADTTGAVLFNETTLTMVDVIVKDGFGSDDGGGIYNTLQIDMTNCSVRNCQATAGDGGGIWSNGTINATNVVVTENTCTGSGAGIYNTGTFTQILGSVTNNTGAFQGGGVHNSGTYNHTDVTIDGNDSAGNGCGINNNFGTVNMTRCTNSNNNGNGILNSFGTVVIDNSTISGNTNIAVYNAGGAMAITHSTIVNNNFGLLQDTGSVINIQNTIIAGNTTGDVESDTADLTSDGYNIFGVTTNPITPGPGDQSILTYAALIIDVLANYGGPTFTHALLEGSPALDVGTNVGAPATDQRGFARLVNGTIDIGSFEFVPVPVPPIPPPSPPIPPPPAPEPEPTNSPFFCPIQGSPCPDPQDAISNFSAEGPDVNRFISNFSGSFGPVVMYPPLGSDWKSSSCGDFCVSTVSQAEADLCAANGQVDCSSTNWPNTHPNPNPDFPNNIILFPDGQTAQPPIPPGDNLPPQVQTPIRIYSNSAQTCTIPCPDGSLFSFTIRAGIYHSLSQASADAIAFSFACQQAFLNRICMGEFPINPLCKGEQSEDIMVISGHFSPFTLTLVSGNFPTGLLPQSTRNTFILSGVPSAAGSFTFVLKATDTHGNSTTKQYTLNVIGIATTSLPDGVKGQPYSATLVAEGPTTGQVTWSLAAGILPPEDFVIDANTGEITGNFWEFASGDYDFTVKMCDQNAQHLCCQKEMTIATAQNIDWSDFNGKSCSDNTLMVSYLATQTQVSMSASATVNVDGPQGCTVTGNITDDVDVNVHYHLEINQTNGAADPAARFGIGITAFDSDYLSVDLAGMGAGTFVFDGDFTVTADKLHISINPVADTLGFGVSNFTFTLSLVITALP